jgi:hypothetical protein
VEKTVALRAFYEAREYEGETDATICRECLKGALAALDREDT